MADLLKIGGEAIAPRSRVTVELPVPQLYTHTPLTMPVHVVRGRPGPLRLFISAAVHGDELNGVEIVRRVLTRPVLRRLRGDLIAVPIVNVYGVIHHSRYLPDRRDLNRAFPGSDRGSLTARLADRFMTDVVAHATHGVDLHTGAGHRSNLPQVRGDLDDAATLAMARAFGVPVMINARIRDGSLRAAAAERDIPMLIYEAGEALRFDEVSIRAGMQGVVNVMRALGMLPAARPRKRERPGPVVARSSTWVRAPESGILRTVVGLGARVEPGERLAVVSDPFGEAETEVCAAEAGLVIGRTNLPLVHQGEALFHVARFEDAGEVADHVEAFQSMQEEAIENGSEPAIV